MKILLEKGDTAEQKMMAETLFAIKMVSVIEIENDKCPKVHKSDDEVINAVTMVVERFGVNTQWTAVYRVLVDFCGWESDVAKFSGRMNTLLKDVRSTHQCAYQSIQKPLSSNSILRKNYLEWKKYNVPKGDRVFTRQMVIAQNLLKLLSISA